MTTQSEKLKPRDHERIWLQPECCADPGSGRLWCQDNVFSGECDDGHEPTEYVRADLSARPLSMTGEAPDFAEMLDVLVDCRRYLTEFGSVEPSSLAFRVRTAIANGRRAKDDRCYREQWAHANGARAARDEPPLTYSQFLAGAEPPAAIQEQGE